MATQNVSHFLINKLTAVALLIIGGLLAAYGMNYSAAGATASGLLLVALGVIVLVLKIVRRNQNQV